MRRDATSYDVIVVGAGPAGASLSIHLAGAGAQVLLVEAKKFPRAKLCGEFITPECFPHFARLGVEAEMRAAGGASVAETRFYSSKGRSVTVPSAWFGSAKQTALGLSRAEMDARLLRRAREAGVEVWEETTASNLIIEEERVCGVRLKTSGDVREARALVTVDGTGRARALARQVEGSREAVKGSSDEEAEMKRRSPLVAFKAHFENVRALDDRCEIYFYKGGYGGLSPVEAARSNLCFIVASSQVRARGSDVERVMREVLMRNERAQLMLRDARRASPWVSVALGSFGRGKLIPAEGLITIGDAAAFIDPFTGSGMLMALESGELAAEIIARRLPHLQRDENFAFLAADYEAQYKLKFERRLRICAWLRRAAFAPQFVHEAAIFALRLSNAQVRRKLARATRQRVRAHFGARV
ncbi:MAG: NAD(P)/FAD-dependent oxidoreductase [Pyrinomonadaceae bacterium]|nr:NAD(P)/FAD-dependent oxidoreductase [Pyrinomonadaceae bacterium]